MRSWGRKDAASGESLLNLVISIGLIGTTAIVISTYGYNFSGVSKKLEYKYKCQTRADEVLRLFKNHDNKLTTSNWHPYTAAGEAVSQPPPYFTGTSRTTDTLTIDPSGPVTPAQTNTWILTDSAVNWATGLYNRRGYCGALYFDSAHGITVSGTQINGVAPFTSGPLAIMGTPISPDEKIYLDLKRMDFNSTALDCTSQGSLQMLPLSPANLTNNWGIKATVSVTYSGVGPDFDICTASTTLRPDADIVAPALVNPVGSSVDLAPGVCPNSSGTTSTCDCNGTLCLSNPGSSGPPKNMNTSLVPGETLLCMPNSTDKIKFNLLSNEPAVQFLCGLDQAPLTSPTESGLLQSCNQFINSSGSLTVTQTTYGSSDAATGVVVQAQNLSYGHYVFYAKAVDSGQNSSPLAEKRFYTTNGCPAEYTNQFCPSATITQDACGNSGPSCVGTKPPDCADPSTVACGTPILDSCGRSCPSGNSGCASPSPSGASPSPVGASPSPVAASPTPSPTPVPSPGASLIGSSPTPTPPPSSWVLVGNQISSGNAYLPQISFDSLGTPYVAFGDGDTTPIGKASVMKFNGGAAWTSVGAQGFSACFADDPRVVLDSTGTPYIGFGDGRTPDTGLPCGALGKDSVMKFDGTNWVYVGMQGFTPGVGFSPFLVLDASNTPYVAFGDAANGSKVSVMKFDGTNWAYVGGPGFSPSAAFRHSVKMAIDRTSGSLYVFYIGAVTQQGTVMKWDGTSWSLVGSADFTPTASYPAMAIDSSGTLYITYTISGGLGNPGTLMKFNGSSWTTIGGGPYESGTGVGSTKVAFDSTGTPYVAFFDNNIGSKVSVMQYNGSSWNFVGTQAVSPNFVESVDLAISPSSNIPFVIFPDGAGQQPTVMCYGCTFP